MSTLYIDTYKTFGASVSAERKKNHHNFTLLKDYSSTEESTTKKVNYLKH